MRDGGRLLRQSASQAWQVFRFAADTLRFSIGNRATAALLLGYIILLVLLATGLGLLPQW